jgi:glucose/arabinose dehydrogenase
MKYQGCRLGPGNNRRPDIQRQKGPPMIWKHRLIRVALVAAATAGWFGGAHAAGYQTSGTCAGFPGVALQTPADLCVGLVAKGLGFARGVAVKGDTIYVLDMGGWRKGRGRLLRIRQGGYAAPEVLISGLDEPNGLAVAADGTLYAGLLGRVVRVVTPDATPRLEDVLTGLPATGRHPLSALAAAPDGSLYVNVGSATDHCEGQEGEPPDPKAPCPERATTPARAGIVRFTPGATPIVWAQAQPVASGLRNSMGLAVMPNGALLAAVNARDAINAADPSLSDDTLPHDTFDVIAQGADYGWPYCFDDNRPSPEYRQFDCGPMHKPDLLLPAHAAPLGLLVYRGDAIAALTGQVVLPYHGYRAEGHRLMRLAVGADGRPTGTPEPLIWGWDGRGGKTPLGSPVGVAEMADGSVLVTEDHNGTLLRLARK